jgi:hypothetical protein
MPSKNQRKLIEQEGRKFAEMLYDLPLKQLINLSQDDQQQWKKDFPALDERSIENIINQVREARQYHQEQVGWQAIPHDLTVILFVLGTLLFGLTIGIIIGIAALVFFESLFQIIFIRKLYRPLSLLVWLTYPAYVMLGYYLHQQGYAWYWILAAIIGAWFGTFLLGIIARIPMRLMIKAKQEAALKKSQMSQD